MEGIDDFIKFLDNANEKDIQKIHEVAKNLRKLADLIDELADPEKTEEEIENIFGQMVVLGIKLKKII